MNIYKNKSKLKLTLLAIALLIGGATLYYTNYLAQKLATEEKNKIKLWAEAIENKAALVRYTNQLFQKLETDERTYVTTWAKATELILTVEDNESITFLSNMISSNTKTPMLLVQENGKIISSRNFEYPGLKDSSFLRGALADTFSRYPPILIDSRIGSVHIRQYIYYQDSKLFSELKAVLNNLIESFISEVVINTASVPVIMTNEKNEVISFGNLDSSKVNDPNLFNEQLASMKVANEPIVIDLGTGEKKLLYYEKSYVLNQLQYFPLIQLGIIAAFLLFSYLAFSSARKSEQNQVWVGMSKETAHQLGTPISSLSAWVELIKETPIEELKQMNLAEEMEKDINRLALVAERFSKIGSKPDKEWTNAYEQINEIVDYYKVRSSRNIEYVVDIDDQSEIYIIPQLFKWVLENLVKNALDSMEDKGELRVILTEDDSHSFIDVRDTGKGIPKNLQKEIFNPGISTKARGWGLGLSLSKRIIEVYHKGKIFVKESSPDHGATFRIVLPKG